jgi:hypothetical protein
MIGSFGTVVFEVSNERVRTFEGLQRTNSARYTEHELHQHKSLLEYTGNKPSSLSMSITLDAALGVPPEEDLEKLRKILREGKAVSFILGGVPQGDNLWVLERMTENAEVVNNRGEVVKVKVSLSLKEYVEEGAK